MSRHPPSVVFGCNGPVAAELMHQLAALGRTLRGVCRSGRAEAPPPRVGSRSTCTSSPSASSSRATSRCSGAESVTIAVSNSSPSRTARIGLGLPRARLQELALQLGADVPVFVFGQSAFAEGVGEVLTPIALQPAWYVVLVPPVTVATAGVFAAPELTRNTPAIRIADFLSGAGRNDLQAVVEKKYPEVAAIWPGLADLAMRA